MAQLTGVKTSDQMQKMLAQMEGAFQEIAITNPREGMRAAIQASAGRLAQGVPLNRKRLGTVAAAAIGEPDAARAATNVEQFSRVAAGPIRRGDWFWRGWRNNAG
jgi:DNA invertase Pin-like site-specific DNA recombinase